MSSLKRYGVLNFSPAIPTVSEEILKIAGKQVPYFRAKPFSRMMKENEEMFLSLGGCKEGRVIFLTASGTGAMDAIISNIIFPEDRVLIVNGGAFGQRFKDICDFYKINSYNFKVGFGKRIDLEELRRAMQEFKPSVVLTQHIETSSGQTHDIKKIGILCKEVDAKFIVDAIGSFGNDEYRMDEWNVDATLFSSHKGLGLFSGTSAIILNKKLYSGSFAKRCFYFDFNKYLEFGLGHDMAMPFTPNVSSMIQLNYRLRELQVKGMNRKIQEVAEQAEHFRSLIRGLPLRIVAEDPSNCLTALYTERMDVKEFYEEMVNKSIYFSPTGGKEGKKFIVTHMGEVNKEDNIIFVEELKKWLNCGETKKTTEKVVYTGGTWDLFHVGHLNLLKKSKALGDKLIVGVSTDELVESYKKMKPIIPYEQRLAIVQACAYVDLAIPQKVFDDKIDLKAHNVNIITVGSDWKGKEDEIEGLAWAKEQGIGIIFLDYTLGVSTSSITKSIISKAGEIIEAQVGRAVNKLV